MQRTLFFKILAVIGLTLLICVPLALIQATVNDRIDFRAEAVASIAHDSVGEQTVMGPVVVVSYTDEYEEQVTVANDKSKVETVKHSEQLRHLVFPNQLNIKGKIDTDRRYRGIHQVLVFGGQHAFSGDFVLPALDTLPKRNARSRINVTSMWVALGIDDVRGIRNIPKIDWDGTMVEFEQGSYLAAHPSGLHAPLAKGLTAAPRTVNFSFDLGLDGIENQHFVPVGKNNSFTIKSNWPHPQFGGRFLPSPRNRSITDSGFEASWSISSLAANVQQQLASQDAGGVDKRAAAVDRFSIGFIEPVNVYSLADRATKYGLLFVALTFAAFFVFEILKSLPIHPVQYLLVGLALVLFFLLLLSLSEHIDFKFAYAIASSACIVLIGYYLGHVLHDRRRGFAFGAALTMLYSALYGLLISESNALVMGSILLFAVLAALMVATRKVDWYQIGKVEGGVDGTARTQV
jgi:inner membrane protein